VADERDPGLPDPAGEGGRPGRPSLFARIAVDVTPLRTSRDFRRLWVGQGVSFIGSMILTVAIPYQTR